MGRAAESVEALGLGRGGAEAAGEPFLAGWSERDVGCSTLVMRPPLTYRRRAFPWETPSPGAGAMNPATCTPFLSVPSTTTADAVRPIDADTPLMEAGVKSQQAVHLAARLQELSGAALSATLIARHDLPPCWKKIYDASIGDEEADKKDAEELEQIRKEEKDKKDEEKRLREEEEAKKAAEAAASEEQSER